MPLRQKQQLDEFVAHVTAICNNMILNGKEELLTKEFLEKAYMHTWKMPVQDLTVAPLESFSNLYVAAGEEENSFIKKPFFQQCEIFLEKNNLCEGRKRQYRVVFRALARYRGYVRATDRRRCNFELNINTITRQTLEDFFLYVEHESELQQKHPRLFERLLTETPEEIETLHHNREIHPRGSNVLIDRKKCLKAYFNWLLNESYILNNPFQGMKIGTGKYGTPYYINIKERNLIATADLAAAWPAFEAEEKKLAKENDKEYKVLPLSTCLTQRDVFVFQCLIGCRVGDLIKLNLVPGKRAPQGHRPGSTRCHFVISYHFCRS